MLIRTAGVPPLRVQEAGGPQDYDAALEWRTPS